jgi:hypothetical protein
MHALLKTIACMFSKVGGEERRGGRDKEISCNLERSALADFGELLVEDAMLANFSLKNEITPLANQDAIIIFLLP